MSDFAKDANVPINDCISRQAAIDALWKALYEYEDETEKKFQESEDLDIQDWIQHRIFVQNMSDIDRQTILSLPSAQPERKKGQWIDHEIDKDFAKCSECGSCWEWGFVKNCNMSFCPNCGADMRGEDDE